MIQRHEFIALAILPGANVSELCRRFGVSRKTGYQMREIVRQWTGIPIGVGVAATKVLAKLANRQAKKTAGLYVLDHGSQAGPDLLEVAGATAGGAEELLAAGIKPTPKNGVFLTSHGYSRLPIFLRFKRFVHYGQEDHSADRSSL